MCSKGARLPCVSILIKSHDNNTVRVIIKV